MKSDILTLKALFQKDVRYLIPTFQRPYVWNQEEQWEPLWNDVRNIAEEYLEQLNKLGEDKRALAEEQTGTHFMGAVVLQQQPTSTVEIDTRHVIDGQQRLTTLQLLLDAAQEVFEMDDWPKEAKQLRKLVMNDEDYATSFPENVFKVWPTLVDRIPFRHAMSNDLAIDGFEEASIVQAHEFFKLQVREWLGERNTNSEGRASGLVTALIGLLEMVVIDLQPTDDANVIFETLNARGTPLLDSDLIKNSVLHTAGQTGINSEVMYRKYWQEFDQTWWRAEVRQGRLVRPRIDVYLNYWLTMRTAEEVQSTRFFPQFTLYSGTSQGTITDIVADIHEIAKSYRQLTTINDGTETGQFLYRWRVMDAGVTTPVIMWLLSHRDTLGEERLQKALRAIESYLVRRMVCRMTTKDYNNLFLEIMKDLSGGEGGKADEIVVAFLGSQTADARVWPSNAMVKEVLLTLPLYQLLTRGRLRMVLEGLEDALRSAKSEEQHVQRGTLTIEHIMPQGWREHWATDLDDQDGAFAEVAQKRDRLVQTIGNLTLVNDRLNPALSNSPWSVKKEGIGNHSVLYLNKRLLDTSPALWNEAAIQSRGEQLAAMMATVWPVYVPSD